MSEAAAPETAAPVHQSAEDKLTAKAEAWFATQENAPPEPEPEPQGDAEDVAFLDAFKGVEEGADDDAAEEPEAEPEAAEAEGDTEEPVTEEAAPGSESDPWTLKDLPDEYVTVKIDGEEQTLPLRQLAENGMRQQTFDRRAHELKQLTERAETMLSESQQSTQQLRAGIAATFSDPQKLMPYLDEHYPEVLDALALEHYPTLHRAHEEGDLKAYLAQRKVAQKERSLAQERERMEGQRRQQAQAQALEAKRAVLVPAMKAAALAAKVEPTAESMADIGAALNARATSLGRDLTAEEIESIATRFLRTYADTGAAPKPRKPRQRARKAAQATRRSAPSRAGGTEPAKHGPDGRLSNDWLMWKAQNKRQA